MDLQSNVTLNNRYLIQYKLGQGGMGAVYLARDTALDSLVAVKANLHPAPESTSQFLREARLLAALRHPNLPRVTDYFILDDVQYLVMDYVPGKDLDSVLKDEGPQPAARVLAWANQLGSALSYMHRQDPPVIHRDIKPGNIRLSAEGEAILVDFGIAKAVASDQATETAARGYTPGFAPPEQYGGMRTSPRSDQYSLAATLYTLLAGQKPSDAIQRTLGEAVLTPLRVYAPETPPALQAAIEQGLSVRPEERFPDMDAFIQALNSPTAEPTVMRPQAARAAPVAQIAPAADATVVAGAAPAGPVYASPPAPAQGSGGGAGKSRNWILWAVFGGGGLVGLAVIGVLVAILLNTLNKAPRAAATLPAVAVVPGETPTDTPQPSPLPEEPTETPAPPTPTATETALPPTDTAELPTATATLLPLGQGGIVVFASDRADGQTLQLWTLRASLNDQGQVVTSDLTQLTDGSGDKTQPRWSPDGSQLLFVAPGESGNGLDIWRMPSEGGTAVNLTQRKGDDTEPAWSPDGSLIAFTSAGREDGVLQLFLMNADGSGQVRLSFDQEEFGPTWSPDMQALAFVMNASGRQILNLRGQSDPAVEQRPYYVTPQRFDYSTLVGSLGQVAQPAWSPDGNWIAYTRQEGSSERVFVARYPLRNPDQEIVKLSEGPRDSAPAWAADSQWLAFNSQRDGNPEVYVMRANGQSQMNLSNSPGVDRDAAWKPIP